MSVVAALPLSGLVAFGVLSVRHGFQPAILIGGAILLVIGGLLAWTALTQLLTDFRSDGVHRFTLQGRRVVLWSEVESLHKRFHILELTTQAKPLQINLFYFRNPEQLVSMCEDRVRPQ